MLARHADVDVVIFGGGVVGLWTTNLLIQKGYNCLLIENGTIGGAQTLASQGIIHGGTKYALTGRLTGSSQRIKDMPSSWRASLAGEGVIDLSDTETLSEYQYIWTRDSLLSKSTAFLASKLMRSRVAPLASHEYPDFFNHDGFSGAVYRLDEPVINVRSMVHNLYKGCRDQSIKVSKQSFEIDPEQHKVTLCTASGERLTVGYQACLFSAGEGNRQLLESSGLSRPAMQLRPLHMVAVKGRLPLLYAHCLGGSTPRVTITSHRTAGGDVVWAVGGALAEQGVALGTQEQVALAKSELAAVMPWHDLSGMSWSGYRISRAEERQPGLKRPDSYSLSSEGGIITVWPTKLAFTPRLARDVCDRIEKMGVMPSNSDVSFESYASPSVGDYPWESMDR